MGAGLTGDGHAAFFCFSNHFHALLGGNVAHMVTTTGIRRQAAVPLDHLPLRGGRNTPVTVRLAVSAIVNVAAIQQIVDLAVGGDHLVQRLASHHRFSH